MNPAGPAALAGVAMNPATMIFGGVSTGTVTLTAPAPAGGAVIALSGGQLDVLRSSSSVTIPAGATTAQFTVTSTLIPTTTFITAIYNGVNETATLESVNPTVIGLACAPNPVIGGNTTVCTVTMNGIMPSATGVYVSVGPAVLRARRWLGDGAGRCGQCRVFPPDEPCPCSDRCEHLG